MVEFLELVSPEDAISHFLRIFTSPITFEEIETAEATGRVNTDSIRAENPLPEFTRSTVDGYAVIAVDTHGASDALPAYLRVTGEIEMGGVPDFSLTTGTCGLIHTGGMLPEGANAVIMVEYTQTLKESEIEIYRAVGVGENVILPGEDVSGGDEVIPAGTRIRPAEIGGLMALGVTRLKVTRRPLVGIISSGDEVVPPHSTPRRGMIRDVNSYSLSALVEQYGGIPKRYGIVKDVRADLSTAIKQSLEECDLTLITAGSSASVRDLTAEVINELGDPGVIVHGINIRPGKPTILAACQIGDAGVVKPVIGLPGNPVSALIIAMLVVGPTIDKLSGLHEPRRHPRVRARLSVNLASLAGREEWIPVRLIGSGDTIVADPVFGKSNLIFSLSRADGLVRIAPSDTGLDSGVEVDVFLLS